MRRKLTKIAFFLLFLPFLQGCTDASASVSRTRPDGTPMTEYQVYENSIADGVFYVRHSDSVCEPVYFGEATFDKGSISATSNDKRVLWFASDYERIPTLYKGESLIYYTKGLLNESFNYERFEDFGYSIGLRGLEETDSGRYKVYTDPAKKCSYPGSDADKILEIQNKTVIIDSIGNVPMRVNDKEGSNEQSVTRCGSVAHLSNGEKYSVKVYEGTVEHDYIMTANIRIMASMSGVESADYSFIDNNKISLKLPESFHSGYYLINGAGLFRYIDGTSFDEASTDMNIPNSKDGAYDETTQVNGLVRSGSNSDDEAFDPFAQEGLSVVDSGSQADTGKENAQDVDISEKDFSPIISRFNISSPGMLSIKITFEDASKKTIPDAASHISATLFYPSGRAVLITNSDDDALSLEFEADETGTYKIRYENLDKETPNIEVITL